MRFHGNHVSWGINHFFISLYSKYQPSSFICSSIVFAPVISSLDEIYCIIPIFLLRYEAELSAHESTRARLPKLEKEISEKDAQIDFLAKTLSSLEPQVS